MKFYHFLLLCTSLALMSFQGNNEFVGVESNNNDSNDLASKAEAPVTDVVEYPLYHVVFDPITQMLDISLDPQYKDYDPGVFTHITLELDVESYTGIRRTYYGAFSIKGHCWADMTEAYLGSYTMHLFINGYEFNTTHFEKSTPRDHYISGMIQFQSEQFSE